MVCSLFDTDGWGEHASTAGMSEVEVAFSPTQLSSEDEEDGRESGGKQRRGNTNSGLKKHEEMYI